MKLTFFTNNFIKNQNNNTNEDLNVLLKVKNNLKRMSMEQQLYAQIVVLCRKDLKITEAIQDKKYS